MKQSLWLFVVFVVLLDPQQDEKGNRFFIVSVVSQTNNTSGMVGTK